MYAVNQDNPWVRDVAAARWRWPALGAILAAILFAVAVLMTFRIWGGALQDALAGALRGLPGDWGGILSSGALQALIFAFFLAAAIVATHLEGRRLWRGERKGKWGGSADLLLGVVMGAGGFCAAAAIAAVAGAVIGGPSPSAASPAAPVGAILLGAALVAFQSTAEEAFFRGWLQPILCARWTPWIGLTMTSILFGALHIIAGAHGLMAVANLFLGGMLFGLLALRTGGLFAPAAAHFSWNWTESGILGLDPQPTGSVFSLRFAGAPLWNGGVDTMNGSLATSLVLVALTVALALWKTGSPRRPLATDCAP